MPILFALIAHTGWAVCDIFIAQTSRSLGALGTTAWRGLASLAMHRAQWLRVFLTISGIIALSVLGG